MSAGEAWACVWALVALVALVALDVALWSVPIRALVRIRKGAGK